MKIEQLKTIPNVVTTSRLFFGLLTFFFLLYHYFIAALIFYILGAATDAFDGYLARKLKQTSELGSILDAIIDRIFIILVVLGLLITEKLTQIAIYILIAWIVTEIIMGLLISKKIKKLYLKVSHRNSIRFAAIFLYITLGALILNAASLHPIITKITNTLIILTAITAFYALIDHIVSYKKLKHKA